MFAATGGVLFHAGQHRTHGRDAQVVDAGRGAADEHDPVANRRPGHLSRQEIGGGS
jgi:hypothetical protein